MMEDADRMREVLDTLAPMHAVLGPTGHVVQAGPTLRKVMRDRDPVGARFLEIFEMARPNMVAGMADLRALAGRRLRLRLRAGSRHALKGLLVPLSVQGGPGALVNLSFGISVVDAVRDFGLTGLDFAPTDLTTEMLYLVEAKSAAMAESHQLNLRLEDARIAAHEQALTDTLTGLKNRRALDHLLERQQQAGQPFALLHLDLDHFKEVNDAHGHAMGDHVLQEAARRMLAQVRAGDVIARVGGDEFVFVLPGAEMAPGVANAAARLIAGLEAPITCDGQVCHISASIGATLSCYYKVPDIAHMMADADRALYTAKAAGRGCHVLHDPDRSAGHVLRGAG
ncbi:diguanylate cyclase domain-containing protein [Roseovarius sp. D22-M7]|uniref:diguanylate cyclase domain-containing protein n=1 Tax=Roseovarius sp. D22-M7 TaxID=3127116 RepID=UPI003010418B